MLVSTCAVCGNQKSSFIKNQEASRLELHWVIFNNCFFPIIFEMINLK